MESPIFEILLSQIKRQGINLQRVIQDLNHIDPYTHPNTAKGLDWLAQSKKVRDLVLRGIENSDEEHISPAEEAKLQQTYLDLNKQITKVEDNLMLFLIWQDNLEVLN